MKEIRKKFRLINRILKTLIKDSFQYPSRLVMETFVMVSRCGILLLLYWYVFKLNNGVINGTTFIFSAWSILFYFSFSILRLREISKSVMEDVKIGNVEMLFSKPISYVFYRIWWQIGSGLYSFVVVTTLAVLALIFIIGLPHTMTIGIFIPTLVLTFICGIVLSLFMYLIIGLLAFWIEDINPVFWIVDKTVMILGGAFLPVTLFPAFMFKVALWSPFGASQFVTHTVNETWQANWYQLVGIQLFWIFLLGLFANFLFQKVKKKVSVNGG
jgi:ABC-2 type transport system permease protein